jgi:purine-cytosine permease-like protein
MILQQNWKQLSSIQVGGIVCLPAIMIGHALHQTYGFTAALLSILLGNFILLGLGIIMASMSFFQKKTTVESAVNYFGKVGVALFAMIMVANMIGWFAIQLNVMTLSLIELFVSEKTDTGTIAITLAMGTGITLISLFGMQALNRLANMSIPLLVGTVSYLVCILETKELPLTITGVGGTSFVIAAAMGVIVDMPTYFRHAQSKKDALISVIIIFGFALPLVELMGVYLGMHYAEGTILAALKGNGGYLWHIWVALFLFITGWTMNSSNLYSAVASIEFLLPQSKHWLRTLLIGGLGTGLACVNLLNHFELILEILGILITSLGAIIVTCYFVNSCSIPLVGSDEHIWHFIVWCLGCLIGFANLANLVTMTTIPLLDAFLAASLGILIILIKRIISREKTYA